MECDNGDRQFDYLSCPRSIYLYLPDQCCQFGQCPTVTGQSTLDTAQYLGVWYEYQRFPAIFEAGLDCTTATYGDDGARISVVNAGTLRADFFGRKIVLNQNSVTGFATVPDPAKPAELSVSFGPVDMGSNSPNYIIQDTDYTNYAVVFSCSQLPGFNIQFAWILTRAPGVAPSNLATLESNLAAAGVDVSKFKVIDQTDCPGRLSI
ncbi:hypothetical protein EGW08_010215 [Elysia chlorotica]|uniref:Apolipoprotein D n=1 Tax=Elysia chlorotica TaxID=188477 RepID=A0A433TKE9_ELYCH|nr:hypothetical protein EGW08_010215 [Elysia chlorotica]